MAAFINVAVAIDQVKTINRIPKYFYIAMMLLGCIAWIIGVAVAASVLLGNGDRHEGVVIYSALLVSNGMAAMCFALALLCRFAFRTLLPTEGFYQYRVGVLLLVFSAMLFCWLFAWMFLLN